MDRSNQQYNTMIGSIPYSPGPLDCGWGIMQQAGNECCCCTKKVKIGATVLSMPGATYNVYHAGSPGIRRVRQFIHFHCVMEAAEGTPMDRYNTIRETLATTGALFSD